MFVLGMVVSMVVPLMPMMPLTNMLVVILFHGLQIARWLVVMLLFAGIFMPWI